MSVSRSITYVDRRVEQLGLVASLMCRSTARQDYPLSYLTKWIEPAIAHRQIYYAFGDRGRPLAYWTWALLASEVEHRLMNARHMWLHESEWNEGDRLWILDFVAPHGYVRDIVKHLHGSFFALHNAAYSMRWAADGSVRSCSFWQRRVSEPPGRLPSKTLLHHLPSSAYAASQTEWFETEAKRLGTLMTG